MSTEIEIPEGMNMCPTCEDAFIPYPYELICLGDGEHTWEIPGDFETAYKEALDNGN